MTVKPVVLGLGSNRGNSRRIVFEAMEALGEILTDCRGASLYLSAPLHVTDQNYFINTAAAGFYQKTAGELLAAIHEIETRFGRDRSRERRWGERSLDIDILLFGDKVIAEEDLTVPHPRLAERRFALEPLLEILPGAAEPGTGRSYRKICDSLPDQGVKLLPD